MMYRQQQTVHMERILFATDFSEVSAKALPYAAAFARHFGADLCIAHVVAPEGDSQQVEKPNKTETDTNLRRQADEQIDRLLQSAHLRGVRHETIFAQGEILPTLASISEEREADLIVLGMHGRHGLAKALLGSVAEEILRLAEMPVLVVGPDVNVQPERELTMHGVLYAADFSPGCGLALQYAGAIATEEHARLLVLHVVEDVWREPVSTRLGPDEYLRLKLLEKGWMTAIEAANPRLLVEFGPVEDRILQTAEQERVELLVLDVPSTNHPVLSAHLPGSMAYNVASHAPCPVLAVRGLRLP